MADRGGGFFERQGKGGELLREHKGDVARACRRQEVRPDHDPAARSPA